MKYGVTCTRIYNGYVEVEAKNEEEAFAIADKLIADGKVDFHYGETTADYVDELGE